MAKIKWNRQAFQEIRRSPEVRVMLGTVVNEILGQLPDGYEGSVTSGRTRLRGSVVTAEYEAIRHNSEYQALLRALANARV